MQALFTLKKQQQTKSGTQTDDKKKTTSAEIRVHKDISELSLTSETTIEFANKDDLLNFKVTTSPKEGFYKGGSFAFTFKIPPAYPHDPPKVHCETPIYHPNIDTKGNVCLNVLREDWKPVLSVSSVIYGLQYLFLEPNPDDPLNTDAADLLKKSRSEFEQNVYKSLHGGTVNGISYPRQF